MTTNTDQYFITQTLAGNTQAYGQLVEKYQDYVFTVVVRMIKVREEAEEIAQDTFIKAYESLASFRGDSKFSSWLYSIAYRKTLDALRKKKRQGTRELIEDVTEGTIDQIDNALEQLERKEQRVLIQESISKLPAEEAALITFYYFEDQSIREIAGITNLSEQNIKVKLYRSRKKLCTLLQGQLFLEDYISHGKAL